MRQEKIQAFLQAFLRWEVDEGRSKDIPPYCDHEEDGIRTYLKRCAESHGEFCRSFRMVYKGEKLDLDTQILTQLLYDFTTPMYWVEVSTQGDRTLGYVGRNGVAALHTVYRYKDRLADTQCTLFKNVRGVEYMRSDSDEWIRCRSSDPVRIPDNFFHGNENPNAT